MLIIGNKNFKIYFFVFRLVFFIYLLCLNIEERKVINNCLNDV